MKKLTGKRKGKLVDYLETISEFSFILLIQKFDYIFEQLEISENMRKKIK